MPLTPEEKKRAQEIYASLRADGTLKANPRASALVASLVKDGVLQDLSGGSVKPAPAVPAAPLGFGPDEDAWLSGKATPLAAPAAPAPNVKKPGVTMRQPGTNTPPPGLMALGRKSAPAPAPVYDAATEAAIAQTAKAVKSQPKKAPAYTQKPNGRKSTTLAPQSAPLRDPVDALVQSYQGGGAPALAEKLRQMSAPLFDAPVIGAVDLAALAATGLEARTGTPQSAAIMYQDYLDATQGDGGAAGRAFAGGLVPAAGSYAGFSGGATLGSQVPGPPLVKAAGGLIGGMAGAMGGGATMAQIQEWATKGLLTPEVYEILVKNRAKEQERNKLAVSLGQAATALPFADFRTLLRAPLGERAMEGGVEVLGALGENLVTGKPMDFQDMLIQALSGAALPGENRLGRVFTGSGERIANATIRGVNRVEAGGRQLVAKPDVAPSAEELRRKAAINDAVLKGMNPANGVAAPTWKAPAPKASKAPQAPAQQQAPTPAQPATPARQGALLSDLPIVARGGRSAQTPTTPAEALPQSPVVLSAKPTLSPVQSPVAVAPRPSRGFTLRPPDPKAGLDAPVAGVPPASSWTDKQKETAAELATWLSEASARRNQKPVSSEEAMDWLAENWWKSDIAGTDPTSKITQSEADIYGTSRESRIEMAREVFGDRRVDATLAKIPVSTRDNADAKTREYLNEFGKVIYSEPLRAKSASRVSAYPAPVPESVKVTALPDAELSRLYDTYAEAVENISKNDKVFSDIAENTRVRNTAARLQMEVAERRRVRLEEDKAKAAAPAKEAPATTATPPDALSPAPRVGKPEAEVLKGQPTVQTRGEQIDKQETPSAPVATPVKPEPWQMTRESFVAQAPKLSRQDDAPDFEKMAKTLRATEGAPGISDESLWAKEDRKGGIISTPVEMGGYRNIVFRDESGQPKGILKILLDGNKAFMVEVAVTPDARRQGIASKLYKFAQEKGYDVEAASGESMTAEGASLFHARAVRRAAEEGKPVPSEVLKDYAKQEPAQETTSIAQVEKALATDRTNGLMPDIANSFKGGFTLHEVDGMTFAVTNDGKQFAHIKEDGKLDYGNGVTAKASDEIQAIREGRSPANPEPATQEPAAATAKPRLTMSIKKGVHTKKGHDIWTVSLAERVERDEYNELNAAAKALGGYYSAYGAKADRGFIFKDEVSANKFKAEQEGSAPVTEQKPDTPKDAAANTDVEGWEISVKRVNPQESAHHGGKSFIAHGAKPGYSLIGRGDTEDTARKTLIDHIKSMEEADAPRSAVEAEVRKDPAAAKAMDEGRIVVASVSKAEAPASSLDIPKGDIYFTPEALKTKSDEDLATMLGKLKGLQRTGAVATSEVLKGQVERLEAEIERRATPAQDPTISEREQYLKAPGAELLHLAKNGDVFSVSQDRGIYSVVMRPAGVLRRGGRRGTPQILSTTTRSYEGMLNYLIERDGPMEVFTSREEADRSAIEGAQPGALAPATAPVPQKSTGSDALERLAASMGITETEAPKGLKFYEDMPKTLPASSVIHVARNSDGGIEGAFVMPTGTSEDAMRATALQVQEYAEEATQDIGRTARAEMGPGPSIERANMPTLAYSKIQSVTVATDAQGNISHAISQNGKRVAPIGTDEAKAISGDMEAFGRVKAKEAASQAQEATFQAAGTLKLPEGSRISNTRVATVAENLETGAKHVAFLINDDSSVSKGYGQTEEDAIDSAIAIAKTRPRANTEGQSNGSETTRRREADTRADSPVADGAASGEATPAPRSRASADVPGLDSQGDAAPVSSQQGDENQPAASSASGGRRNAGRSAGAAPTADVPLSRVEQESAPSYVAPKVAKDVETGNLSEEDEPARPNFFRTAAELAEALADGRKLLRLVKAVETLKEVERQARTATPEEQKVLADFPGWGWTGNLLSAKNAAKGRYAKTPEEKAYERLTGLLDKEEFRAALQATQYSHFTAPEVIVSMWDALRRMGYTGGGSALEPSMGNGLFFQLMPEDMRTKTRLVGVEKDSLTGRIAAQLFQGGKIFAGKGFEEVQKAIGDNSQDIVISNVPFGNLRIFDPEGEKKWGNTLLTGRIHNWFFAKSLEKVKPGGIIAFITSNGTLDANDAIAQETRAHLARGADFLGAIRLPNTAFQKNAGTEVTTDIIFLRKKGEGVADLPANAFQKTVETEGKDGQIVRVNEYFVNNPDMVLGTHSLEGTMRHGGGNEYALLSDGRDIGIALAEAIEKLPAGVFSPQKVAGSSVKTSSAAQTNLRRGALTVEKGKLYVSTPVGDEVVLEEADPLSPETLPIVEKYIGIRDTLRDLINAQLSPDSTDRQKNDLRKKLKAQYDAFVKAHGPLHKGRAAGKPAIADHFITDPNAYDVLSLEKWDRKTRKVTGLSDIFSKDVIAPNKVATAATDPKDALGIVLRQGGRVDMEAMLQLLKEGGAETTEEVLYEQLNRQDLLFKTPQGSYETAEQYGSGNVREKLEAAKRAAIGDESFQSNVKFLEGVQPPNKGAADIVVGLGASWVPTSIITEFLNHLGVRGSVSYSSAVGKFDVTASGFSDAIRASSTFGTNRINAAQLLNHALRGTIPKITDYDKERGDVVNVEATEAAGDKLAEIREEWNRWVYEDANRANELVDIYNEKVNVFKTRQYDGSALSFPGQNPLAFPKGLRAHQKNAVWRIIQDRFVLLAHEVGTGKTATMITAAMELRRMGLRQKPLIVVKKPTIGQFAETFKRMYPAARILVADSRNFSAENRKEFMAQIATGDWDAVIVWHNAFEKLSVSPETATQFYNEQIENLETFVAEQQRSDPKSFTAKQAGKKIETLKAKLSKLQLQIGERQDDSTYWDDLGVDQIFIDESQTYKNLSVESEIEGMKNEGNQITFDMLMKIRGLQARGGGAVFASGTPLTNSIAEIHSLAKYLRPDLLRSQGQYNFDDWARTYGSLATSFEQNVAGQYTNKQRFNKFTNVQELMALYRSFADSVFAEDIPGLVRPKLVDRDGKVTNAPIVIETLPDEQQKSFFQKMLSRAETIPSMFKAMEIKAAGGTPDTMLKISTEGRQVSLDPRLVIPGAKDNPNSKVNKVVKEVLALHKNKKHAANQRTQLIFLDQGVPGEKGEWNLYQDITDKLVKGGVDRKEIAWVSDAKTDEAREALFERVSDGSIRIMLGSREKMGVGVNVQERLIAIHQVDPTWRPDQMEQADGRIIRQGNLFAEDGVHIFQYVNKGSFDGFMWKKVAAKLGFINQLLRGDVATNEVEDLSGEDKFSLEQMFAVATGDERVERYIQLGEEVRRLGKAQRYHLGVRADLLRRAASMERALPGLRKTLEGLKSVVEWRNQVPSPEEDDSSQARMDAFARYYLDPTDYEKQWHKEAMEKWEKKKEKFYAVKKNKDLPFEESQPTAPKVFVRGSDGYNFTPKDYGIALWRVAMRTDGKGEGGYWRGARVQVIPDKSERIVTFEITPPGAPHSLTVRAKLSPSGAAQYTSVLDSRLDDVDRDIQSYQYQIANSEDQIPKAREQAEKPFAKTEELEAKTKELADLTEELGPLLKKGSKRGWGGVVKEEPAPQDMEEVGGDSLESPDLPMGEREASTSRAPLSFDEYEYYGIRSDDESYEIGDVVSPSRVWIDGEPTDDLLNGTSSTEVRAGNFDAAWKRHKKEGYLPATEKTYIIAGDTGEYGEDYGEIVIRDAVVVGVVDRDTGKAFVPAQTSNLLASPSLPLPSREPSDLPLEQQGGAVAEVKEKRWARGEKRPWEMTQEEYDQQGYALRRGPVYQNGSHFATGGGSTYFDSSSLDKAIIRYDISRLSLADTKDRATLLRILNYAKKHPDVTSLDSARSVADLQRVSALIDDANDGLLGLGYGDHEELGLSAVAKKLGYDGIRLVENDDVESASTVFAWNTSKIEKVGFNHEVEVEEALKQGKDVPADVLADYPDMPVDSLKPNDLPLTTDFDGGELGATLAPGSARVKIAPIAWDRRPLKDPVSLINQLADATGKAVLVGKTKRGTAGTYRPSDARVRIRMHGNVSTTLHEIAHALDDDFRLVADYSAPRQKSPWDAELFQDELLVTAKTGMNLKMRRAEAVAEYMRAYAVNPDEARALAPTFTDHVEKTLPPTVLKAYQEVGTEIRRLQGAPATEAALMNIKWGEGDQRTIREKLTEALTGSDTPGVFGLSVGDKLTTNLQDYLRPVVAATEWAQKLTGARSILPENDPILLMRLHSDTVGKVGQMLDTGFVDARGEAIIDPDTGEAIGGLDWLVKPLLRPSVAESEKLMKLAAVKGIAERTLERSGKLLVGEFKTGIGLGLWSDSSTASAVLNELASLDQATQDDIDEGLRRYRLVANAMLDYMVDSGRMTRSDAQAIKDANNHYISLQRVMEDAPLFEGAGKSRRLATVAAPIKKAKGSVRQIRDPFVSLLDQTYKIVAESDRNKAMDAFIDLFRSDRELYEGDVLPLSQVASLAEGPIEGKTVKVFHGGVEEYWEINDPDVYKALKGLGTPAAPTGPLKVLAALAARIPRALITGNPAFAVRNISRDMPERWMKSEFDSLPWESFKKFSEQEKARYALSGGTGMGFYGASRQSYAKAIKQVVKDAAKSRTIIRLPSSGALESYQKLLQAAEIQGRLPEYAKAFTYAKKEMGYDDYNAGLFAAGKARGLMDFAVAGNYLRAISPYIPFVNASVQGFTANYKALRRSPRKYIVKFLMLAAAKALPLVLLASMGASKLEEYRSLPAYQRDLCINLPLPWADGWLSIPVGFEAASAASGIERSIDRALGNKDAYLGYFTPADAPGDENYLMNLLHGSLAQSILPVREEALLGLGGVPGAISEIKSNYDTFRQRNIVPQWEVNLPLSERKGAASASRAGQLLGKMLSADPRAVDHFIQSVGGGTGTIATTLSNAGREDKPITGTRLLGMATGIVKEGPGYGAPKVQQVLRELSSVRVAAPPVLNRAQEELREARTPAELEEAKRTLRAAVVHPTVAATIHMAEARRDFIDTRVAAIKAKRAEKGLPWNKGIEERIRASLGSSLSGRLQGLRLDKSGEATERVADKIEARAQAPAGLKKMMGGQ